MPKYKLFKALGGKSGQAGASASVAGGSSGYGEMLLEGRGPGDTAIMVRCLTDDRSRTAEQVRAIFAECGGRMGESGSVSALFDEKGLIVIEREHNDSDEDTIVMMALESGADDVIVNDECFEIVTQPEKFEQVKAALGHEGYGFASAAVRMLPGQTVKVKGDDAWKLMKMMEAFEDNGDVQDIYANFDADDEN